MRLDSRRKDDGDHIVAADEIARAIRCAMDGDSGIRKKVKEMSEIARKSKLHEQQLNAFKMVKELGLAVEMRLDSRRDQSDLVMANEIAKSVRCVMDGDSEIRRKVKEMAEISRKSLMDGGSSFISIRQFIDLNF
ncbi:hypothetical protein LWI29_030714 [Acer saccharum]|uniref:Uncharacterized protein n=1 Tax=Acer saccharum TaxID=4024 RepID=A0AA39W7W8_ACESA|nr:hypothetical protein LWI29_030714 [Acer saccharum]